MPDFQERPRFAARAMLHSSELGRSENFTEMGARDVLCAEILDCLAAFFQGKPLPPERKTTTEARAEIEDILYIEGD
jgi:hypothetical protein